MVVDLKHVGTTAWLSEMLKISVKTSVSCSAQSLSTRPGMLSGPAALRGLTLDRVFLTVLSLHFKMVQYVFYFTLLVIKSCTSIVFYTE